MGLVDATSRTENGRLHQNKHMYLSWNKQWVCRDTCGSFVGSGEKTTARAAFKTILLTRTLC